MKLIGDVEVAVGVGEWYSNVTWNTECEGCAEEGTIPDALRD